MDHRGATDRVLRYALLAALLAVLALAGLVMWRLARVLERTEESLVAARTQIEELSRRVSELEAKAGKAVGLDDLETALDRMGELRDDFREPGSLGAAGEAEIEHLLRTIRSSGLRFEAGGDSDSALQFYLRSYAKYRAWKRSLRSADDFIDKLASRSLAGYDYAVILEDGRRRPLADWLREALAELRAAGAPARGETEPQARPRDRPLRFARAGNHVLTGQRAIRYSRPVGGAISFISLLEVPCQSGFIGRGLW